MQEKSSVAVWIRQFIQPTNKKEPDRSSFRALFRGDLHPVITEPHEDSVYPHKLHGL